MITSPAQMLATRQPSGRARGVARPWLVTPRWRGRWCRGSGSPRPRQLSPRPGPARRRSGRRRRWDRIDTPEAGTSTPEQLRPSRERIVEIHRRDRGVGERDRQVAMALRRSRRHSGPYPRWVSAADAATPTAYPRRARGRWLQSHQFLPWRSSASRYANAECQRYRVALQTRLWRRSTPTRSRRRGGPRNWPCSRKRCPQAKRSSKRSSSASAIGQATMQDLDAATIRMEHSAGVAGRRSRALAGLHRRACR